MMNDGTLAFAKKLWKYHHVHHTLEKSDCILVLGSHDLRVAERAAQLYLEGWAPLLIFSGGLGNFTKDMWTETETDLFAAIAIKMGVPKTLFLLKTNRPTQAKTFYLHNNCLHKKILIRNLLLLCKNLIWSEEVMQHLKNIGLIKS
jgi:hypothetical protein